MMWWFAADENGKRLNRYSYLTETAVRRAHPGAYVFGTFAPLMAKSLEGVA